MNTMLLERPITDACCLPPACNSVMLRMNALAGAIGGLIDPAAGTRNPLLERCLVMSHANLCVVDTACRRPLLLGECDGIARTTGLDLMILRHDADRGATFDIRLDQAPKWLLHYVAWRAQGDLWLIPEVGSTPMFRATAWGLETEHDAPFGSTDERRAGIRRAFAAPFFAGEF